MRVVPMDIELDYTFPRYNPNPEDMKMLHAMAETVKAHGADVGLGSMAMAIVAASSTIMARKSSPTRSA